MEVGTCNTYEDVEDGEISDSSDDYTPLQRPQLKKPSIKIESMATEMTSINEDTERERDMRDPDDSASEFDQSTDSSSDSDDCMKTTIKDDNDINKNVKKEKRKRTVLIRVKPTEELLNRKSKFKKYDIWAQSLQEDSLMENMRGIDVAKNRSDRNVENYDFALKYRLNGENTLKRRLSTSDDMSEGSNSRQYYQNSKRTKSSGRRSRQEKRQKKKSSQERKKSTSSCDSNQNAGRAIFDLNIQADSSNEEIAREIANKLYEEKDDLLLRVVQVLGKDLPIQIFKETQKIEKEGGLMIINGKRRRTPGGVFLYLLKHNGLISPDDRREIFVEERKTANRKHKSMQAIKRDKKVEELKKRLSEREREFNSTSKNKEAPSRSLLKPESISLSNPPPSPVTNGYQELSPEYKPPTIINHVVDTHIEKLLLAKSAGENLEDNLTTYDDDFLDMHCDDMELM
ncbi:phosphorylated adapter RNA export protein [Condylostylus longicornis]|uniref:phosphorylated adapter RNA export protein n=1 Tax=Condylostylus longicornis TaxID=2530218 RepID=UPI00244E3452|nr:phosphorylated adapter RNA export protein [Condylostylus longicornis]